MTVSRWETQACTASIIKLTVEKQYTTRLGRTCAKLPLIAGVYGFIILLLGFSHIWQRLQLLRFCSVTWSDICGVNELERVAYNL